jgi:hypothetical protein
MEYLCPWTVIERIYNVSISADVVKLQSEMEPRFDIRIIPLREILHNIVMDEVNSNAFMKSFFPDIIGAFGNAFEEEVALATLAINFSSVNPTSGT